MRNLNPKSRWVVPTALAATLVAALFISPALGGPSFVSGKKVVKTITKKTNATQLVSPAPKPLSPTEQILATLELRPGSYVVSSTFTVTRNNGAQVRCVLRIAGVAQDVVTSSQDIVSIEEESAAMETAGRVTATTPAQLACNSPVPASVRDVEITALKVPKLTVIPG